MRDFYDFASAHGLLIRDLQSDGHVHRCPTADHPRKRNGAYSFDGEFGWCQDWATHDRAQIFKSIKPEGRTPEQISARRKAAAEAQHAREIDATRAAREAQSLIDSCEYTTHAYLQRKGFPEEKGFVDRERRLLVPMRAATSGGAVMSAQRITEDGTKRFLHGSATKGAVYLWGNKKSTMTWYCEGYATGLSVRAALKSLYRQDRVVVCFSASNLTHVAPLWARAVVVADNDESGTGEAAARATGLPWAMPATVGMDANDLHQFEGLDAVRKLVQKLI